MQAILHTKPFDKAINRVLLFVRRNSIVIIIFNLFFLACFNIFAEEKEAIQTYYPADIYHKIPPPAAIEIEINILKESMKSSGYFSRLIVYKAVRENDLSVCDTSGDRKKCVSVMKELLAMRTLAEGNCDAIKNGLIGEFDLCGRLKRGDCDTLIGWQKDMCNALARQDFSLLKLSNGALAKGESDSDFGLLEKFAVFIGFKNHSSKMSCDTYGLQLPLPRKFICEVMFSTQDVDEILDKIALDVALFTISKKYGKATLCDRIKDSDIRKRCRDKVTTEIW